MQNKKTFAALCLISALAGCSALDLGPEPSNFVGAGRTQSFAPTDANLQAVTPVVPGDSPTGAAMLPGAAMTALTMPAATQAATGPSTIPAATRPALGHIEVPDA